MGVKLGFLTLKEEHRLRAFENGVVRIFLRKRDEVRGGWRRLHDEELRDLYSSPSIIRIIRSRRMRCPMGEKNTCKLFVGRGKETTWKIKT
jgi:hypothetical protein